MSSSDLDDLAAELGDFAPPEAKGGRPPREERVIAGFEDIQRFYEKHGFAVIGERRFLVGATWHDDRVYGRAV